MEPFEEKRKSPFFGLQFRSIPAPRGTQKAAYTESCYLSFRRGADDVRVKETRENDGEVKMERHLSIK